VDPPDPIRVALMVGDLFDSLGIPYLVGGSIASSILGEPRSTDDVDVVAAMAQAAAAVVDRLQREFFVQEDAVREAVERHESFNAIHRELMLKVDVFVMSEDDFHREAMKRRRSVLVTTDPPRSLFVSSAEDTVLQKLLWYRLGGEVSEKQWRDVKGVLKVQRGRLDGAYLDRWARTLGLEDLFSRVLEESGGPR